MLERQKTGNDVLNATITQMRREGQIRFDRTPQAPVAPVAPEVQPTRPDQIGRAGIMGRWALAAGVAAIGLFGDVRPASAQAIEMGRDQCTFVPEGALVVGDAEAKDGRKFYPDPQSGEFANMTWMNQGAEVCFPYKGKYMPAATRAYADAKVQEAIKEGAQANRGAKGMNEWHFPGNLPVGGEVRHSGTGALEANLVCPEPVMDKLLAAGIGWQRLHRQATLDADGVVKVNGAVIYAPDDLRTTGMQVRIHGSSADVQVETKFGGDYECLDNSFSDEQLNNRGDNKVNLSKQRKGFQRVDVIHVRPDGSTYVEQR